MLKIQPEQLDALTADVFHRADQRLADYARQRFPRLAGQKPQHELVALCAEVRRAARTFRIEREDNVATFLDLTLMYGPDFPRTAWAAPIIGDEDLTGPERIEALKQKIARTGVTV